MEKKSTIHGTSVSYGDSTHKNNSRENMYTRHKTSTFMINKETAMYHCNTSISMINKDDYFSTNIYLMALSKLSLKSKMAENTPEHPGREQNS